MTQLGTPELQYQRTLRTKQYEPISRLLRFSCIFPGTQFEVKQCSGVPLRETLYFYIGPTSFYLLASNSIFSLTALRSLHKVRISFLTP
jgi:hypothetical protein